VTVNLGATVAQNTVGAGTDTHQQFENLIGSEFNDTLIGLGATANTISGGAGNDTIHGDVNLIANGNSTASAGGHLPSDALEWGSGTLGSPATLDGTNSTRAGFQGTLVSSMRSFKTSR
jgi:large repetitive protein